MHAPFTYSKPFGVQTHSHDFNVQTHSHLNYFGVKTHPSTLLIYHTIRIQTQFILIQTN